MDYLPYIIHREHTHTHTHTCTCVRSRHEVTACQKPSAECENSSVLFYHPYRDSKLKGEINTLLCLPLRAPLPWQNYADVLPARVFKRSNFVVASRSPSNTGDKKSKVGLGQEKSVKMLTFWQLTLQWCHRSLKQCHSPLPQYLEQSSHPSSE